MYAVSDRSPANRTTEFPRRELPCLRIQIVLKPAHQGEQCHTAELLPEGPEVVLDSSFMQVQCFSSSRHGRAISEEQQDLSLSVGGTDQPVGTGESRGRCWGS